MTQTIHKYPLQIEDRVRVMMPSEAKILSVQMQRGQPQLWALVDQDAPPEERVIAIRGTGHPLRRPEEEPNVYRYISTFQMHDGALVFHAFEIRPL